MPGAASAYVVSGVIDPVDAAAAASIQTLFGGGPNLDPLHPMEDGFDTLFTRISLSKFSDLLSRRHPLTSRLFYLEIVSGGGRVWRILNYNRIIKGEVINGCCIAGFGFI